MSKTSVPYESGLRVKVFVYTFLFSEVRCILPFFITYLLGEMKEISIVYLHRQDEIGLFLETFFSVFWKLYIKEKNCK